MRFRGFHLRTISPRVHKRLFSTMSLKNNILKIIAISPRSQWVNTDFINIRSWWYFQILYTYACVSSLLKSRVENFIYEYLQFSLPCHRPGQINDDVTTKKIFLHYWHFVVSLYCRVAGDWRHLWHHCTGTKSIFIMLYDRSDKEHQTGGGQFAVTNEYSLY